VTTQLRRVHNDYLQAFAELGMVGMLLLGWIGFVCIRTALNLTSSRYSSDVRFWTIGITLGIVGLLVNAFFSFPFQRAIPPFHLMILAGILASFHEGDNRKFYAIGQRWVMLCSCVIVFMGLIWVVRFHYLGISCDRLFHRLTRFERSSNWQSLVAAGEKAYSRNPARIKTLSLVGRAYIETGEYQKGIEALRKVTGAYPYFMNALVNIGVAYDRIGI
jgi:tetratricopeptide (TPR) repeat protein